MSGLGFKDEARFQGRRCCEGQRCRGKLGSPRAMMRKLGSVLGTRKGELMYVGPMAATQLGNDGGAEVKGGQQVVGGGSCGCGGGGGGGGGGWWQWVWA
ncbi:hypothetical protein SO802_023414 [Lithocarpus litseifolius]|uniref:Uncharacterized protein n=1 Tax=Lithocarpus litseifolius TaxID=425828 RepID=A0AAW2C671_9ROSI